MARRIKVMLLPLLTFWAVTLSAAQNTTFIPRGIDKSINEHTAEIGVASRSVNFLCDERLALHKREGYAIWATGINGTGVSGHYTSIYPFYSELNTKRLFATFLFDATTTTFRSAPYAWILKTEEFGLNMVASNGYPFHYATEPINCATYNGTVFMGRKYGRPLRFHGNVKPLVEPPPGTWEYTPMAETLSVDSVSKNNLLNGKYWYAMRNKVISIATGPPPETTWVFIGYPDSLNLHALSYGVTVDSDWVFIHSPEIIPTSNMLNYDRTILQICRTRANRQPNDSFFLVGTDTIYDTTTGYSTFHFIDSIKDSRFVASSDSPHCFVGFVDTVYRTQDTASGVWFGGAGDSALRLGAPEWKSTFNGGASNAWKGISKGYNTINDTSWQATLYAIAYYDSATGMVSQMGSVARIPVAYRSGAADSIYDTALQFYVPPLPSHKRHLWRLLLRAQETQERVKISDTTRLDWSPALYYIEAYTNEVTFYCADNSPVIRRDDGSRWCRGAVQIRDTILRHIYYSEFRIIDTIKTNTDTSVSITRTDTLSWSSWTGKPPFVGSGYIGPMDYPVVLNDRLLWAGDDNRIYFSYWGEYGSEPAVYRDGDNFSVNLDNGDEITGMIVDGNAILITQNNTIFRATEAGKDAYNVETYLVGVGCIAPKTLKHDPNGGVVFLSSAGLQAISGPLRSQYKESGGTISPSISKPIQAHLDRYPIDTLREAVIWFDEGEKNMWLSFPTIDTSFVLDASGQWHQQTIAPKMVVAYDTAYSADARPDKRRVFILDSSDDIYKFGGIDTDNGDSILAQWKSHLMYATGDMGKITEFKLWKHSNDSNGVVFNVYDIMDTGVVATVRDSTGFRVKRRDVNCPESEGFKIELRTYADSLTIDRVDLKYLPTGPMPVD